MKYQAVLFDLDGTLLDTIEDLTDSMNAVLERLGFPLHNIEEYKLIVGEGIDVLIKRSLPDSADLETVKKAIDMMKEEYGKRYKLKTKPYPGIPELLDELVARKLSMSIFSNKPDEFTSKLVSKLFPAWHFDVVLGEGRGIPKKPNPEGALKIANQLNIKPEKFLYLGDTGIDMQTAKNAGMMGVGVLWGFRSQKELIENGAKHIILHPLELFKILE